MSRGSDDSTYVRRPPYFDGMRAEIGSVDDVHGARCLVSLGDSVTTDHISPAGSIKPDSPAGRYLVEHGVERADFNSYGSRRGNHEVMVRGTFANVRLRNLLVPGSEGTWTVHLPSGDETTIFEAAERYLAEGVPTIVLAGKEYGSGSSRDWAAKGPNLLGVKAAIAESYERIHRSNLLMMGILPLQFLPGESRESLGLTGREEFSVTGVENGEAREVTVRADEKEFRAILRLDTPREREYVRHGGILPYVLRKLLAASEDGYSGCRPRNAAGRRGRRERAVLAARARCRRRPVPGTDSCQGEGAPNLRQSLHRPIPCRSHALTSADRSKRPGSVSRYGRSADAAPAVTSARRHVERPTASSPSAATLDGVSGTAEREELWGGETAKAVANFPVSGEPIPVAVAHWLGRIKAAAARANADLGLLDPDLAQRIAAAGDRIAAGEFDDQFPIDVFQTGSGTSSNMNANEVIASLAGEGVHANDHVNMGQSSNDVFPSAVHLAALDRAVNDLLPALEQLAHALEGKAKEFDDVVKSGRTHLMDAVPVTLGQEFSGYAAQVRQGIARVQDALPRLGQIPLGGTATGTGLNTHPEFAAKVRELLHEATGLPVSAPADPFEAQAARDGLVEASGALKVVAVSLTKIANDLRLMGSGPRAGLSEIFLPELQKGSSIMPGKVNPVIPEVVTQVAAQVIGNDTAITIGGMNGHFELNVYVPLIARNLLQSIGLLASASRLLADKCVSGIEANRERNEQYAEAR